jgi:hypothetical protein
MHCSEPQTFRVKLVQDARIAFTETYAVNKSIYDRRRRGPLESKSEL